MTDSPKDRTADALTRVEAGIRELASGEILFFDAGPDDTTRYYSVASVADLQALTAELRSLRAIADRFTRLSEMQERRDELRSAVPAEPPRCTTCGRVRKDAQYCSNSFHLEPRTGGEPVAERIARVIRNAQAWNQAADAERRELRWCEFRDAVYDLASPVRERSPEPPSLPSDSLNVLQDWLLRQPDREALYFALMRGAYVRLLADSGVLEPERASWCVAARDSIEYLATELKKSRDELALRERSEPHEDTAQQTVTLSRIAYEELLERADPARRIERLADSGSGSTENDAARLASHPDTPETRT